MVVMNKTKLRRKDIVEKLYRFRKNNLLNNDANINKYLNIIEKSILTSYFESNKNFLMLGRRKFLFDELFYILNKENNYIDINSLVYFALGNLEEFICNRNQIFVEDVKKYKNISNNIIEVKDLVQLRIVDDNYYNNGFICLEEKEVIELMIKKIKEYLNNV